MDTFLIKLKEFWIFISTPPFVPLFVFALILFALSIVGRLLSGFRPKQSLTHTATVCFSIIFVYVVSIVAFGEDAHLQLFAAALPFMNNIVDGTSLALLLQTDFLTFLAEMTQVFFLGLTISLIKLIGNKIISPFSFGLLKKFLDFFKWYIVECIIVFAAMLINVGIDKALEALMGSAFAKWLPVVIFVVLAVFLLLLLLKGIFKTAAFFASPFIGALSSFFLENTIGKTIKSAFFTTILITAALVIMSYFGWLWPLMTYLYPTLIFGTAIMLIIIIAYVTWIFY
ncbi:MAG: hypothetical protein IJ017_09005 [Oscillospiraceae bacterium]|nr:hypothetical protein [Oscillospiraceae bacterium]